MAHPQSYYVLGWTIILIAHNWPVFAALLAAIAVAIQLWRRPTRRRAACLYGVTLLGIAYEYHKHVAPTLQDAANYLLIFDLLWLNRPVYMCAGPVMTGLLVLAAFAFLGHASLGGRRPVILRGRCARIDGRRPR